MAAALFAAGPALAAVTVPSRIPIAKTATVRQPVREQCRIQTQIPEAIANSSADVQLVEGSANLALEITGVHAPGGWIFSGPKWIEVKGTLTKGGQPLSFRAKRFSAFDPFAGGTCGILAKISRALGADIAAWLANPTPNAEIGDAQ